MMEGFVYVLAERLMSGRLVHWTLPAAALILFCLVVVLLKLFPLHWVASDLLLAFSFALFLGLCIRSSFGDTRGLGRIARLGSRSSYSLYATHLPIVVFICNFIVPSSRVAASPHSWMLVLLIPAVAVMFAILFSRFTEEQTPAARRWVSGILKPSPAVSRQS